MVEGPSEISKRYAAYLKNLAEQRDRHSENQTILAENAKIFYDNGGHVLFRDFSSYLNPENPQEFKRLLKNYFSNKDVLRFAAIDGTCGKNQTAEFIVFYASTYVCSGQIVLNTPGLPRRVYDKNVEAADQSLFAYVQIPYFETDSLIDIDESNFAISDSSRVFELSNIHTSIMELAEIYRAVSLAKTSPPNHPDIILLDHSLSSIISSNIEPFQTGLRLFKATNTGGNFLYSPAFANVVMSHPYLPHLTPTAKRFSLRNWITAMLCQAGTQSMLLSQLKIEMRNYHQSCSLCTEQWQDLQLHTQLMFLEEKGIIISQSATTQDTLYRIRPELLDAWERGQHLFLDICNQLFEKHNAEALIAFEHDVSDPANPVVIRHRLNPKDFKFLISLGIRILIEECYAKKILLIGIDKDSDSNYLFRNYLKVAIKNQRHPEIQGPVPILAQTDRRTMLDIVTKNKIDAPLTTIEYDSCFMTLTVNDDSGKYQGAQGYIINQERMLMKNLFVSLASFDRYPVSPIITHPIFVERLITPNDNFASLNVENNVLGIVRPFFDDPNSDNRVQKIVIGITILLTSNIFVEALGQPDPLHIADQGAKTNMEMMRPMLKAALLGINVSTSFTFRQMRDMQGGINQ